MQDEKPVFFHVKVNDFSFSFTQDEIDAADCSKLSATAFNLLQTNQSINAVLLDEDESAKQQVLEIEGEKYTVQIKDELDQVLDAMGYSADTGKHSKEIKAPMPGLVVQVHVTEGQQVKEGDKLLVLVAMKMENNIMVHADATIRRVAVVAGQAVEKGQLLIELD